MTRSKLPSAKGRCKASPWTRRPPVLAVDLAGVDHGADGVAHLGHLVGTGVERHYPAPRRAA